MSFWGGGFCGDSKVVAETFISWDSKEDIVLVIELKLVLLDEALEEGLLYSPWLEATWDFCWCLHVRGMQRVIGHLTWILLAKLCCLLDLPTIWIAAVWLGLYFSTHFLETWSGGSWFLYFSCLFCRYSARRRMQQAIWASVGSSRALAMKDVLPWWQKPSLSFLKLGMDIVATSDRDLGRRRAFGYSFPQVPTMRILSTGTNSHDHGLRKRVANRV